MFVILGVSEIKLPFVKWVNIQSFFTPMFSDIQLLQGKVVVEAEGTLKKLVIQFQCL